MKRYICTAFTAVIALGASAQQSYAIQDPQIAFKEAKDYFQKEYYSLAYPIFKELDVNLQNKDRTDHALQYLEIKYYTIVCGLKQMSQNLLMWRNNTLITMQTLQEVKC